MEDEAKKPGGIPGWVAIPVVLVVLLAMLYFCTPIFVRNDHRETRNETAAVCRLKNFVTIEAMWRQNDTDGNGRNDYWTGDISAFYRVLDAAGNPGKIIDISVAKADVRPLPQTTGSSRPQMGPPVTDKPASTHGYFFTVMILDDQGNPYQQDGPDADTNAWENEKDFAFCAWPEKYNASGINTFIVNGDGVIWRKDFGPDSGPVDRWPGPDPAAQGWVKVE